MKTLIKVDHLHLGYDNQEVINDLSFDIQQGDFITVLGPLLRDYLVLSNLWQDRLHII